MSRFSRRATICLDSLRQANVKCAQPLPLEAGSQQSASSTEPAQSYLQGASLAVRRRGGTANNGQSGRNTANDW